MTPHEEHSEGLAELEAESPEVFSWKGKSWSVLPGSVTRRNPLVTGGFSLSADLSLVTLFGQFDDYDAAEDLRADLINTVIGYRGQTFKADAVTIAPGGFQLRIEASASHDRA